MDAKEILSAFQIARFLQETLKKEGIKLLGVSFQGESNGIEMQINHESANKLDKTVAEPHLWQPSKEQCLQKIKKWEESKLIEICQKNRECSIYAFVYKQDFPELYEWYMNKAVNIANSRQL